MEESTTQDVIQTEETVEASSAEEKTEVATPETTPEETPEAQAVPYERFAAVIKQKKELEKQLNGQRQTPEETPAPTAPNEDVVKQQLQKYLSEMGYVHKDQLEEKERDHELQENIKALESKYNGADGRPKFERSKVLNFAVSKQLGDLEAAYKLMNEAALIDHAIKVATGKIKGVKSESSDGSGSVNAGVTNDDLLSAAKAGDESALQAIVARM